MRLGDRIAVMSQGGHVEQFATPAELLGKPASEFVADFVGADRGLKRLAVTGIDVADLEHPPVVHVADGLADARAALRRPRAPAGPSSWTTTSNLHGWLSAERAAGDGHRGRGGAAHGGVGAGRRVPEGGVRRRCCRRGRLGGGARRRPVPRRAHPRVAARGAAPLGRGRPETRRSPAPPTDHARASAPGPLVVALRAARGTPTPARAPRPPDRRRNHSERRGDGARPRRTAAGRPRARRRAARPPRARRTPAPTYALAWARTATRATIKGSTGRTCAVEPGPTGPASRPDRAARSAREPGPQGARAQRLGDGDDTERDRQPPVQRREIAVVGPDQQPGGDRQPERDDAEVAAADRRHWRWSQRTTAATSACGSAATRSATRPRPGQHRRRVQRRPTARGRRPARAPAGAAGSAPGRRRAPACRRRRHGDHVDVEGARPPAHLAGAAGRLLELVRARQPAGGVAAGRGRSRRR